MRVVHLSRGSTGGAGIAARRLHAALLTEGVDSHLLTTEQSDVANHHLARIPAGLAAKVRRRLGGRRRGLTRLLREVEACGGDYEIFTLPYSYYPLHDEEIVQSADIVNLHWVGDYLDWPSFFENVSAPIVWTLHDMNPFLGGFHYLYDRDRNPQMRGIEARLQAIKRKTIAGRRIEIVALNEWMESKCRRERAFAQSRVTVIPNGVDLAVFSPLDRREARRSLDLPLDKRIFLFVSQRTEIRRKGLDLVRSALDSLCEEQRFLLVTVGGGRGADGEGTLHWGPTSDQEELVRLYAAADALLLPSREDNQPNVMVEALCCGTPVISSSNGGMRELIRDGLNGVLMDETSPEAVARSMREILDGTRAFDRRRIRDLAAVSFDMRRQARGYLELYERVLSA